MHYKTITIETQGEKFYDITAKIKQGLSDIFAENKKMAHSGILHIFTTHTSCSLTISESFDPSAAVDMQNFLKHLAKRDLKFITHTSEGSDDSPSHMKSILLHQSLGLIVDQQDLIMGTWQGIYLAEFRDMPKRRKILIKYQADSNS